MSTYVPLLLTSVEVINKTEMWKNLNSVGIRGSENGVIIYDEEYKKSCRITLEKCERYHAITCGVYGTMVHTVLCGTDDSSKIYEAMKKDLQEFIDKDTTEDEELDFYESFGNKY